MISTKTNNKIDYSYNLYLSDCDLINKYTLRNVYQKPHIKNIVVDFSIKNETSNAVSASISAAVIYVLTNFYPYVITKKSKNSNSDKHKNNSTEYNFKAIFSNKQEINSFLSTLLVENWNTLLLDDFVLFSSKFNETKICHEKEVFKIKIPIQSFFELDMFFSKVATEINPKNFEINLNLLFFNFTVGQNRKNTIQNLPNFWISG